PPGGPPQRAARRPRHRSAQRHGAVAGPVSLPIASRYCTLPSRIRSAVPVIRPLRSRKVVTLPLVELLPGIWPRSFRNVCCCATAGPASSASTAARVIVLIVRSSRLLTKVRQPGPTRLRRQLHDQRQLLRA